MESETESAPEELAWLMSASSVGANQPMQPTRSHQRRPTLLEPKKAHPRLAHTTRPRPFSQMIPSRFSRLVVS